MALVCAVHCLLTPLLIIVLPIIATSFWVDENFHFWMLSLVVPLTAISFFIGCRKHHDIILVILAVIGIGLLFCGVIFGCSSCQGDHYLPSFLISKISPMVLSQLLPLLVVSFWFLHIFGIFVFAVNQVASIIIRSNFTLSEIKRQIRPIEFEGVYKIA